MQSIAERTLVYARTQTVLKYAFMAAYAMAMKLEAAPQTTPTAATDGKSLFYNPRWIETVAATDGKPAVIGLVLHEALHNALGHIYRRGNRDMVIWNQACDYVVNAMILALKIPIPSGGLYCSAFEGLTAEAVYALLAKDANSSGGNGRQSKDAKSNDDKNNQGAGSASGGATSPDDSDDTGADSPDDGTGNKNGNNDNSAGNGSQGNDGTNSPDEGEGSGTDHGQPWGDHRLWEKAAKGADADTVRQKWQRITAVALAAGRGSMPIGVARHLGDTVTPRPKLGDILARYIQPARNDFRWLPPDRNFIYAGLYLPSLRGEEVTDVVVAIDTSGSIDNRILSQFLAETKAQLKLHRFNGYVVCCDARVHEWHEIKESVWPDVKFKGGGGTNFAPVFEEVKKRNIRPTCLVFLTDLDGSFPREIPPYPVLWAVYGRNTSQPPFGQRFTIE